MKVKASLFGFLYGIGFRIARRWVMDHERRESEIKKRKSQITNAKSRSSANPQDWATVYGAKGRRDAMQSLGDAGDDAGPLRHARRQDDGS